MPRLFFIFAAFFLFATHGFAFDHSHSKWNEIVKANVVLQGPASSVKYKEIKAKPEPLLEYLKELQKVTKADYEKFSSAEKQAFLINAYNAYTVDLIVRNYPLKSINELGSLVKTAWKRKEMKLLGETVNLDNIEHDMARGNFKEPRLHFAFVCASIGCPQLRNEAWTAAQLESQYEDAARKFVSDSSRNRYVKEKNRLELSSIFKWYRKDFDDAPGGLFGFLANRITSDPEAQKKIREGKSEIKFLDYNWELNDAPAGSEGAK